jgi:hypothetical protein
VDEELRADAREATTPSDLFRLLASLVRSGSLDSWIAVRPIFRLRQRPGVLRLLSHPWPKARGTVHGGGKWWSVGPGRWNEKKRDGRVWIQPTTDNGKGWSNPNRSYPFDTLDDLLRWLEPRLVDWRIADPVKRRKEDIQ